MRAAGGVQHQSHTGRHEQQRQMLENDRRDLRKIVRNAAAKRKKCHQQHHAQDRPRHVNTRQPDDQLSRKLEAEQRGERCDQSPNP
jgi:hypothetical protein